MNFRNTKWKKLIHHANPRKDLFEWLCVLWLLFQFASGFKSIWKSYVDSNAGKAVFSSVLGLGKFINSVLIFVGIVGISNLLSDQWTDRNCIFWFCAYRWQKVFTDPVIPNMAASQSILIIYHMVIYSLIQIWRNKNATSMPRLRVLRVISITLNTTNSKHLKTFKTCLLGYRGYPDDLVLLC